MSNENVGVGEMGVWREGPAGREQPEGGEAEDGTGHHEDDPAKGRPRGKADRDELVDPPQLPGDRADESGGTSGHEQRLEKDRELARGGGGG